MAVVCLLCDKVFSNQSHLNRHRLETHNLDGAIIQYEQNYCNYKCLEGCHISFKSAMNLRYHLSSKHNSVHNETQMCFETYEQFLSWLEGEEKQNNVQYSRRTGNKMINNNIEKMYLYCVRSGMKPLAHKNRKRSLKSQGSCKLNKLCTSQVIVSRNLATNKYHVQYYQKHYGHDNEIQHLKIQKSDREVIASKLFLGIPAVKILESTRDQIKGTLIRGDIIARKDIDNIKAAYNIQTKDGCRHHDDATSVNLWVQECAETDNNPVLFYKKQGDLCPKYELQKRDFCLIIMNNVQLEMLKKFGNNVVAVDSTHGLNAYDFEMTTLLVLDEFGEGMPVACMFTNRKDSYINAIFFTEIRNSVGLIQAEIFMSDITNVFHNPWANIMGQVKHQLYCSWHVDRAWQSNLSKITDQEKRKWVYKTLKYLQTTMSEETFIQGWTEFLNLLDDQSTINFKQYLIAFYDSCITKWAYCYRRGCNINTNMHLESMHKTLKYYYLEGKKIKRLDKTLHMLIKFIRDKTIERIIKLTKGKATEHIAKINARHRTSLSSIFIIESGTDINNWSIRNEVSQQRYTVSKKNENSICCPLKCTFCNICIHAYDCTCVDFNIKATICKHIHFFVLNYQKDTSGMNFEIDHKEEIVDVTQKITNPQSQQTLVQEIETKSLQLINNVRSKDHSMEQLKQILQYVKNANGIESFTTEHFRMNKHIAKEPGNKKVTKQMSFYSTWKKRSNYHQQQQKPTEEEIKSIKEVLSGGICISTDSKKDHNYL